MSDRNPRAGNLGHCHWHLILGATSGLSQGPWFHCRSREVPNDVHHTEQGF